MKLVIKPDSEWKKILTPEQFRILRRKGTEPPFTKGNFNENKKEGIYLCVACDNKLFLSKNKFDSGTGWPSFTMPANPDSIEYKTDWILVLPRKEVLCKRCKGHLGHVFNDGPPPTGKRFCINGIVLKFVENKPITITVKTNTKKKVKKKKAAKKKAKKKVSKKKSKKKK